MKRLVLTLMVAVATLLGVSALAPSGIVGAYPVGSSSVITTDVPSIPPEGTFTATVENCLPGETVNISFDMVMIPTTCDPTTLQASASFVAPTATGTYEVCAELTGSNATVPQGVVRPRTICTSIQVAASGPVPPPVIPGGGLPATGSSGLDTTTTSAAVLLGAGVMLLVVSQVRRRRSAATA